MPLEDQTLVSSQAIKVSLKTIADVMDNMIIFDKEEEDTSDVQGHFYWLPKELSDFAMRFRDGNSRVLVVEEGGKIKAMYGPVDGNNLYF